MTTEIRDRRVLPALVAIVVAAFLVIPMVMNAATVNAQSQQSEDPCDGVPRSTFEDRNEADVVHRGSIDCVDHYDISSGDASGRFFRPNRLVDRAQMATFIVQTLQAAGLGDRLPNGDSPDEFSDTSGTVHRQNINILARIGVVQGNNGQYNPEADIKRDQMATFLLQAKEWAFQEEYEPTNSYFGDVRPTNPHFDNINAAYEEELVRGKTEPQNGVPNSGTYAPADNVRRQNMASFLSNLLEQVWDAPEQFCTEASPSPTGSASASPSPTSSATASPEASPDASPSATASPTGTASPSGVLPLAAAQQQTTSPSPSDSPCATPSGSPTPSPSGSASPTASASPSPSASPDDCDLPFDPTGIICPEPSESPSPSTSPSPSPTTSASPTSGGGAVLPLDL